jgi:diacylglycerol kinase family enzyme
VEVVVLEDGMDLEEVARNAVARGADCLGMAGGDGSQALVASVAIDAGIPFVCISAGTRNHFAADLGLDRNDPAQGLSAFRDGVLLGVDYGLAGDRLFVNNVSLGLYASMVEQEGYREAKVETALQELPKAVGPDARPYDLQFRGPQGESVDGALLVLVSNNPYVLTPTANLGKRRRLNSGVLGVIAVSGVDGADPAGFVAGVVAGLVSDDPRVLLFTCEAFEIHSRAGSVAAGIDGEAQTLPTPLRLRIVPKGLRLLVPADTIEAVAHRRYREFRVRGLWDIARGRAPDIRQLLP